MPSLPSLVSRALGTVTKAREKAPLFDHVARTQLHYDRVKGGMQAGAITYFGFLSFFPMMALALFTVGKIAEIYPRARDGLRSGIDQLFPGIIGDGPNQISLSDISNLAATLGILGLLGALYSGLGWLGAMRNSLVAVFEVPAEEQPDYFFGKLWDLVTLLALGGILAVSVAVSGVVTGFNDQFADLLNLSASQKPWLLLGVSALVGIPSSTLLLFALFRLLGRSRDPQVPLWRGAILGAVAFEALKLLASYLLRHTSGQPAFQVFGIALIVVVWINYFTRIVLYAAAWAHTSRSARSARTAREQSPPVHEPAEEPPHAG